MGDEMKEYILLEGEIRRKGRWCVCTSAVSVRVHV